MELEFLTTGWGHQKSGIEHAIWQRIKLFIKFQLPFNLVTVEPDLVLHDTLQADQVPENHVINLFDFFGNDCHTKARKLDAHAFQQQLPSNLTLQMAADGQSGKVYAGERIVQYVSFDQQGRVHDSCNYDVQGNLVKRDYYDTRGWRALESLFDNSGNLLCERYFNSQGRMFYQTFHQMNAPQNIGVNTLYQIWWQHRLYTFTTKVQMYTFFYDCLAQTLPEPFAYLVDRTNELGEPVLRMRMPVAKYMYLHSDHINSHNNTPYGSDELIGSLNPNYEYSLNNLEQWQGILMATQLQSQIFTKRYHHLIPQYVIPVGYIPPTVSEHRVPWSSRQAHLVVCVARLSPEKQQEHLIRAFQNVVAQIPDAQLEFWGFDNGEKAKLMQLVQELHLQAAIQFKGYTKNIGQVYDHAGLAVLPSNNEGFALALMEGQAHGVPSIAYDVFYGPHDIIIDQRDGYLAVPNNINDLTNKIIQILSHPSLAQQMSQNAYLDAQRYSEAHVYELWHDFLQHAQQDASQRAIPRQAVPDIFLG